MKTIKDLDELSIEISRIHEIDVDDSVDAVADIIRDVTLDRMRAAGVDERPLRDYIRFTPDGAFERMLAAIELATGAERNQLHAEIMTATYSRVLATGLATAKGPSASAPAPAVAHADQSSASPQKDETNDGGRRLSLSFRVSHARYMRLKRVGIQQRRKTQHILDEALDMWFERNVSP